MAGRGGIETILDLMDEAFRGRGIDERDESQALLTNLASVPETAWRTLPAGASRTIQSIAIHVGACKIMYDDYAFGSAALRFATPEVEPWGDDPAPPAEVIAWLIDAQGRLLTHVGSLDADAELDRPRMTNWGELRPTRWILAAMITHDAYHAGEINHLRSMLGTDDRWRYQQLGFG
jgi:DinB superfamily